MESGYEIHSWSILFCKILREDLARLVEQGVEKLKGLGGRVRIYFHFFLERRVRIELLSCGIPHQHLHRTPTVQSACSCRKK